MKNLTLHNRTHSEWTIHPIIDGEQWSGSHVLIIAPNHSTHYELTYQPMTMTSENSKHQGSVFFPMPDGTGLLYHLQGTSEPPKHVASISQEIPSKTSHTELLPVSNWLRRSQRFLVIIDQTRPDKSDRSVSLSGITSIDVPALGKKDYQLNFFSFRECTVMAKVRSESFFPIAFKVHH